MIAPLLYLWINGKTCGSFYSFFLYQSFITILPDNAFDNVLITNKSDNLVFLKTKTSLMSYLCAVRIYR